MNPPALLHVSSRGVSTLRSALCLSGYVQAEPKPNTTRHLVLVLEASRLPPCVLETTPARRGPNGVGANVVGANVETSDCHSFTNISKPIKVYSRSHI